MSSVQEQISQQSATDSVALSGACGVSGFSNLRSGNWFRAVSFLDYLSENFVAWRSAGVSAVGYSV